MVYILSADGSKKKYACIKCIKGHRSSKCAHQDRELYEIKRKGRPISQCDKCRLLRKTRQLHIKCQCPKSATPSNNSIENSSETPNTSNDSINSAGQAMSDEKIRGYDNSGTSCPQCSRPRLYCNCFTQDDSVFIKQEEIGFSSSSNSSERSITPPPTNISSTSVSSFSSPLSTLTNGISNNNTCNAHYDSAEIAPTTTASTTAALPSIHTLSRLISSSSSTPTPMSTLNDNNNHASPNRLQVRHLIIPIHDPSDDIDSDTPVYKSMEERHENLGEFANKSSEELIHQIYSNFNSANSSASSPLLTEEDDKLVEIARNP